MQLNSLNNKNLIRDTPKQNSGRLIKDWVKIPQASTAKEATGFILDK